MIFMSHYYRFIMSRVQSPHSPLWRLCASPKKTDSELPDWGAWYRFKRHMTESLASPLMLMYFLMLLVNTLLRDTKDTLLVTSKAGVEAIPVLKSWVVIPSSVIFFICYSKLSRVVSRKQVFVIIIGFFVAFYILFGIFLYPLKHKVGLSEESKEMLLGKLPDTFGPRFVSLVDEWPLALFFVVSELWSSGVCQLMFWQVANDVMSVKEAKAFYPVIGAMGNLGMVVAGHILMVFADQRDVVSAHAYLRIPTKKLSKNLLNDQRLKDHLKVNSNNALFSPDSLMGQAVNVNSLQDPVEQGWSQTLAGIALMLMSSAVIILMCYNSIYSRHKTISLLRHESDIAIDQMEDQSVKKSSSLSVKKSKPKVSLMESFRTLSKSQPLRCCAILVISYGIASCLVEVSWKGQVKNTYKRPNDYSRFMAQFWSYTGIVSMLLMVVGRYVLERCGYRVAVMFTPIVMASAGVIFFLVAIFDNSDVGDGSKYAAYSGGFLVLTAKAAKYAFFDATKEMIFIPLDAESKSVGKAAIELVAYRLAKSGGSLYLQIIILLWGSVTSGTGLIPIAAFFFFIMFLWTITSYNASLIMEQLMLSPHMHRY